MAGTKNVIYCDKLTKKTLFAPCRRHQRTSNAAADARIYFFDYQCRLQFCTQMPNVRCVAKGRAKLDLSEQLICQIPPLLRSFSFICSTIIIIAKLCIYNYQTQLNVIYKRNYFSFLKKPLINFFFHFLASNLYSE